MAEAEKPPSKDDEKGDKVEKNVVDRLAPPTSHRTLKQILETYGKTDKENADARQALDPNHPLMLKFQKDLREQLLKLHHDTEQQISSLKKAIQDQNQSNDNVGRRMCTLQKELVHTKETIAAQEEEHQKKLERKQTTTKKLEQIKQAYKTLQEHLQAENDKDLKLQKQLEDLSLEVVQLKQLQLESYSDSSTMKRALEKSTKDRQNLEVEKMRQDMLIARLEEDQIAVQEKINRYKSQCAIKKDELSDLRKLLSIATGDIEVMNYEKSQLIQQWNYSIASLEKRDLSAAAVRDAVGKCEDDIQTLNMNIKSHKTSIRKELEESEKLTLMLFQRESDVAQVQKLLKESETRQRSLEEQYLFFEQVVQQADKDLEGLQNEKNTVERELETTTKQLEKACIDVKKLETEYMKVLHEKITATKASRFSEKMIKDCKKEMEELENKYVLKKGEEAKLQLKYGETLTHLQAMEDNLSFMKNEYEEKERTIAKSEAEISRERTMIEKKQIHILELNKKLAHLIAEAGGSELGPLEREISHLKKEIDTSKATRKVMEQEWLRYQRELVSHTNEASELSREINRLHKKEAVLEEKKIRIGADLTKEETEIRELSRNIDRIQNDMRRLTAVLYREKDSQERLEQEAMIMKGDFLKLLKDAELDFTRKEREVEGLKKKRASLLQKLLQVQRDHTVWEEKLQAAEDARKMMKSEANATEMGNYKSEIKKLQFRWDQIKREEANIIILMEKAAIQHATYYTKADIQSMQGIKKKSKQYLSSKAERLRRKLQEDKKKLESITKELKDKNQQIYELKREEEKENLKISELEQQEHLLDYSIRKKEREKYQAIILLSCKQKKNKLLEKLKQEKYIWSVRNPERRGQELESIYQSLQTLQNITNQTIAKYPDLKDKLMRVIDYTLVGFKL